MTTLRIEHPVPDFEGWKRAFDSDPAGRQWSGVRRHQVSRAVDDPNHVFIDLVFDSVAEAEALVPFMRTVWAGAGAAVSSNQPGRIVETVESIVY
jgi:hypothetical protein